MTIHGQIFNEQLLNIVFDSVIKPVLTTNGFFLRRGECDKVIIRCITNTFDLNVHVWISKISDLMQFIKIRFDLF